MSELRELNATFKAVFGTPEGKKAIKYLCSIGHIHNCNFSDNPLIMAKNEGERRIVLEILQLANINIQSQIEAMYDN